MKNYNFFLTVYLKFVLILAKSFIINCAEIKLHVNIDFLCQSINLYLFKSRLIINAET